MFEDTKEESKSANRMTDNTVAKKWDKMANNDLLNTTHKTKDGTTWTQLKNDV